MPETIACITIKEENINQANQRPSTRLLGEITAQRVFKNVVRGFSLVHDPKGSHYENLGGESFQG